MPLTGKAGMRENRTLRGEGGNCRLSLNIWHDSSFLLQEFRAVYLFPWRKSTCSHLDVDTKEFYRGSAHSHKLFAIKLPLKSEVCMEG